MPARKTTSTNFANEQMLNGGCPFITTFGQLGGRWKIRLLYTIRKEPKRYSELRKEIGIISEKMLTTQLKELITDGWVLKQDFRTIPPHTEYSLSEKGQSFIPILDHVYDWGILNLPEIMGSGVPHGGVGNSATQ